MSYKQFTIIILSVVSTVTILFSSFNYYIDPLWTFGHQHSYNDVQIVIDERRQKTAELHFQPFTYDSLLIGSSRSTYINPHELTGMNAYNFSVSNLSIREYRSMIDFAKRQHGGELENILLGVDFFKSSTKESSVPRSLEGNIETVTAPLYRFKNLLSYDVFEYSLENLKMSKENVITKDRIYNRSNVANAVVLDKETVKKATVEKIERFRTVFYGGNYVYYPEYKAVMKDLKAANPKTNFIIYTTPISTPLFQTMVEEGQLDDYERWLTDLVDVFGGVYNFMYPNSITNDLSNYFDGHHFYPPVGTMIAHQISGNSVDVPEDFGVYVTKDNLEAHLDYVKGVINHNN